MDIKNKQICPTCETGEKSYSSDKHSESCPYISELNADVGPSEKFTCPHYKKMKLKKESQDVEFD